MPCEEWGYSEGRVISALVSSLSHRVKPDVEVTFPNACLSVVSAASKLRLCSRLAVAKPLAVSQLLQRLSQDNNSVTPAASPLILFVFEFCAVSISKIGSWIPQLAHCLGPQHNIKPQPWQGTTSNDSHEYLPVSRGYDAPFVYSDPAVKNPSHTLLPR